MKSSQLCVCLYVRVLEPPTPTCCPARPSGPPAPGRLRFGTGRDRPGAAPPSGLRPEPGTASPGRGPSPRCALRRRAPAEGRRGEVRRGRSAPCRAAPSAPRPAAAGVAPRAAIVRCRPGVRGGAAAAGKMASRSLRLLLLGSLGVLCCRKATGISIETDNKNVKAEEFKEAILSCKHKFSKGVSLRIEWKKIQSQGVSFVYYNGDFTVPPTTPVCEVPSSAMTGTVVELSCKETEGSPPSEYQWYKNGVPLLEKTGTGSARAANVTYTMNKKSGTLLFNTVTKNDTGEYFCEASNGIGLPQKCSVRRMQVGMCQSNWNCNWNDFIA
uniref:Junctional adhesion molecule 2 n=1 Tax=Anas platyrhynchos platyrhynchos TaxID=8840 RepID=A0A493STC1_ANAPP